MTDTQNTTESILDETQKKRDELVREKKHLEDRSYEVSKKLYMKEFRLALMKGVAIIGVVILILSATLGLFIPRAWMFAITALLLSLIAAVIYHFYNKHLQAERGQKEKIRQEYLEVCRALDQLNNIKENLI